MNKNYRFFVYPSYVKNWGIKEALNVILQNASEADKAGYQKRISYDAKREELTITNEGATLDLASLILGFSKKSIGQFDSSKGYKAALVALCRSGWNVEIQNGGVYWLPTFRRSPVHEVELLNIMEVPSPKEDGLIFTIRGISPNYYHYFVEPSY